MLTPEELDELARWEHRDNLTRGEGEALIAEVRRAWSERDAAAKGEERERQRADYWHAEYDLRHEQRESCREQIARLIAERDAALARLSLSEQARGRLEAHVERLRAVVGQSGGYQPNDQGVDRTRPPRPRQSALAALDSEQGARG